jgi:hypothetical protein
MASSTTWIGILQKYLTPTGNPNELSTSTERLRVVVNGDARGIILAVNVQRPSSRQPFRRMPRSKPRGECETRDEDALAVFHGAYMVPDEPVSRATGRESYERRSP